MSDLASETAAATPLDVALANCASEPIRVPGAIQPHGALLTLRGSPLCIEQVSANAGALFGTPNEALLGTPIAPWLTGPQLTLVTQAYDDTRRLEHESMLLRIGAAEFTVTLHRTADVLIVELEPYAEPPTDQQRIIARVLRNLQAATTLETLFDISVHEIQALTGYDRVMIYRFEPEGHGKVVAQALTGPLPSYQGLNFPAADIPAQARALYCLNWIRVIPDATYTPVPLVPLLSPDSGHALDLSFAMLRSVSPVHCEYLKNMGVQSSMSISLLEDSALWGLITCGHPSALTVSREVRDACALIGQLLSVKIAAIVANQVQREREEKLKVLAHLAFAMDQTDRDILTGLVANPQLLQSLTGAEGTAVLIEDSLHLFGITPTEAQVKALYAWLRSSGLARQKGKERTQGLQGLGIFHCDALQLLNPAGDAYADVASGVVAFILPKPVDNAVMWFRPQLTSTMNWGGDPQAHVSSGAVGSASHRLHPRQSFEVWAQQTSGIARPWSIGDLYAAEDVRRSALEIDLARQVRREQEAVRVRDELVAVVSHDLRNPMSIIIMQCGMMQRWTVSDTTIENSRIRRALGTIESATTRMNTLLEDLLDAAKIEAGGYQLTRVPVNVAGLLKEACALLVTLTAEKSIELNCTAAPGLVVHADPERIFQVLSNLLGNAIKFTPKGGRIDIDALAEAGSVLFQVRDTGGGIPADHLPHIFKRYWSVKEGNPRGNGLGLYISQGIISAHGGSLWAASEPGAGSLFSFTLPRYEGPNVAADALAMPPLGFPRLLLDSVLPTLETLAPDTLATRAELLNELNHRVKNTLSTVQAIAALTASNSDSLTTFSKDFDARLHALGQAHDALVQTEWTSTQLANLIEQVRAPFGGAKNVSFEGDAVTLEPRTSLTLALVLHELMANAAQHGALSLPQGRVAIRATFYQAGNAHALKLDWVETNGPPVAANEKIGFGFRLLRRSVERELKGTLQLQLASAGFRCSLVIPILGKQAGIP